MLIRKLINSLNLQCMESPQLPPKSWINGSHLRRGDTSLWQLICDPCKSKKSCRTAAAGKPPERQGVPVATQAFSHIHIQPWAESTWNQLEPFLSNTQEEDCVPATQHYCLHTENYFFPHWSNPVNSNAKEKKHFWMRQGKNYWTLKFYFLFIDLEFKSKISLGWGAFVLLAVVGSRFWHLFISTHLKI